jgi:hypothetical protein
MARRIVAIGIVFIGLLAGLAGTPVIRPGHALAEPEALADDNATVCRETSETVNTGLKDFVTDMQQVSTQAQSGDLAAADETVRHAGTTLTAIGAKLREQGDADDATLRQAVADLAAEFGSLGGQMTGLAGLQAFDTTRLAQLADQMSRLCGITPSPGSSFPEPLPSSPGPTPSPSE